MWNCTMDPYRKIIMTEWNQSLTLQQPSSRHHFYQTDKKPQEQRGGGGVRRGRDKKWISRVTAQLQTRLIRSSAACSSEYKNHRTRRALRRREERLVRVKRFFWTIIKPRHRYAKPPANEIRLAARFGSSDCVMIVMKHLGSEFCRNVHPGTRTSLLCKEKPAIRHSWVGA